MATAKDIHIAPIKAKDANALVRRVHYSGKVVNNSQLHFGAFLNGRLEGAMQFGPSLDKRKIMGLVDGTGWNGFIELNRMAFSDALPRNKAAGWKPLEGYQLRYIYFLNPQARKRLTVPIIPFSKIDEMGAGMYKGEKIKRPKQAMTGTTGTAEVRHLPGRSNNIEAGA